MFTDISVEHAVTILREEDGKVDIHLPAYVA
jgi:hypothetical protein